MTPNPSPLQHGHAHGTDAFSAADISKTFGRGGFNVNAVRVNFNSRRQVFLHLFAIGADFGGFRKDDGVGPYIASLLKQKNPPFKIIDAQDKPENIIEDVIALDPDIILIIDAADFKGTSGEIRLIDAQDIDQSVLSTHMIPLSLMYHLFKEDTDAEVYFIGIQVKDVSLGEGVSEKLMGTEETRDDCSPFGQAVAGLVKSVISGP